jgi:hypothetical protein
MPSVTRSFSMSRTVSDMLFPDSSPSGFERPLPLVEQHDAEVP